MKTKHAAFRITSKQEKLLQYVKVLFGTTRSDAIRKAISKYWTPIVKSELARRKKKREEEITEDDSQESKDPDIMRPLWK